MIAPFPSICLFGTAALLCTSVALWNDEPFHSDARPLRANAAIAENAPSVAPVGAHSGRNVRIAKASDGLFYVSARVNGTAVRFLIDTGANVVVLTAADARRVGAVAGGSKQTDSIETAGGPSRMGRVTLDRVSVAGRDLDGIDAAVMHDGLSVSLMGQNILSKLGPITMTADEMSLQGEP